MVWQVTFPLFSRFIPLFVSNLGEGAAAPPIRMISASFLEKLLLDMGLLKRVYHMLALIRESRELVSITTSTTRANNDC